MSLNGLDWLVIGAIVLIPVLYITTILVVATKLNRQAFPNEFQPTPPDPALVNPMPDDTVMSYRVRLSTPIYF